MRALTRICHNDLRLLVAAPKKEGVLSTLSCQAFASLLLDDLESWCYGAGEW